MVALARLLNRVLARANLQLVRRSEIEDHRRNEKRIADERLVAGYYLGVDRSSTEVAHPPRDLMRDTEAFRALVRLFEPARCLDAAKRRVGNPEDGGYVMLDALGDVGHALSFGVGPNVSWDRDLAEGGATVHLYDHTVDGPPVRHSNFRFHRTRVAAEAGPDVATIRSVLDGLPAPTRDLVLKIDVEHDEWEILDAAAPDDLARFSQIICEFHAFERASDPDWRARAERVLRKLNDLFQVVHVHGNNCAPCLLMAGVPFPSVLEVTYARRGRFTFGPTDEIFPTALDGPNAPALPDIWLGPFRF